MPLPRNPVIRAGALLRKGDLRDEIDEWFEDSDDSDLTTQQCKAEGGSEPPSGSQPALITVFLNTHYSLTAIR